MRACSQRAGCTTNCTRTRLAATVEASRLGFWPRKIRVTPRKRLILAGIIGRYPVGGVTWCALHYIAGLQRLGYDVFYLEDTGECGFDVRTGGLSKDPSY